MEEMEDIVVKLEPADYLDNEVNEASSETLTEPSTSNNVICSDESTLPYDHVDSIKEEILENQPDQNFDEIKEFCFESDHLALKTNADYHNLLKAIVILEAQRAQAIKDLDLLMELKESALADPIAFVERLQRGEDLKIPKSQKLHQLPVIDWSKYALSGSQSGYNRRQLTRLSNKVTDFSKFGNKGKSVNGEQKPKPNQYWTVEEQKRLEELLVQYPPEEVESRRWEKIASCLENRTPIQVASRVQKYFIKLMKAGIPIPGRMPSTTYLKKPRRNIIRQQPSTFMVSYEPPVYMPDADDDFNSGHSHSQSIDENSLDSKMEMDISDDEEIPADLKDTPEYQELMLLKKIQKEKLKSSGMSHIGYKCSRCKTDPIIGTRWHCMECKFPSVDLCAECNEYEYDNGQHTSEHKLEAIEHASTTFLDRDYMHFLGSDYNYLDPNYMPAT